MQHPTSLDTFHKPDPPPHPGDTRNTKKVKFATDSSQADDDAMEDEHFSSLPDTDSHVSATDDIVPETPLNLPLDSLHAAPEMGMHIDIPSAVTPVPSFKDKLLNAGMNTDDDAEDDMSLQHGDVTIDVTGIIPTVNFADHILDILNKRMGWAVVVKLLGRTIGIRQLRTQLHNIWRPTGRYQVTDLEDDCFLVKFRDDVDFQNALIGGPWQIYGHYLTVQPWTPEFKPQSHVIKQVAGWIRLPRLPARYYHKAIIRSIGSVFGEVIKVDYNTDSGDRGKFARLAVLIDLTKPLISKIQVDGEIIYVEYEGLPTICFHCGRYGHLKESCPLIKENAGEAPVSTAQPHQLRECSFPAETREATQFGAWMQVQRRRRYSDRGGDGQKQATVATSSRFNVLREMTGMDVEETEPPVPARFVPQGEFIVQPRKGKEQRGLRKPEHYPRPNPSPPRTTNKDTIFHSRAYAAQTTDITLDRQHH